MKWNLSEWFIGAELLADNWEFRQFRSGINGVQSGWHSVTTEFDKSDRRHQLHNYSIWESCIERWIVASNCHTFPHWIESNLLIIQNFNKTSKNKTIISGLPAICFTEAFQNLKLVKILLKKVTSNQVLRFRAITANYSLKLWKSIS